MTINNKSERNYRGKCLGWPVTLATALHTKSKLALSSKSRDLLSHVISECMQMQGRISCDGFGNKRVDESFLDKEVSSRCSGRTKQASPVQVMAEFE